MYQHCVALTQIRKTTCRYRHNSCKFATRCFPSAERLTAVPILPPRAALCHVHLLQGVEVGYHVARVSFTDAEIGHDGAWAQLLRCDDEGQHDFRRVGQRAGKVDAIRHAGERRSDLTLGSGYTGNHVTAAAAELAQQQPAVRDIAVQHASLRRSFAAADRPAEHDQAATHARQPEHIGSHIAGSASQTIAISATPAIIAASASMNSARLR